MLEAGGINRTDTGNCMEEDVFTAELDKGPRGLGLGLIDGLVSNTSPVFVSTT